MRRPAVIVGLMLAMTASSVSAAPGGQDSPTFNLTLDQRQYPVEQESPDWFSGDRTHPETWVNNPTACDWDLDDSSDQVAGGTLAASVTITATRCVMADGYDTFGGDQHKVMVRVVSTQPDLLVRLSNDQGQEWLPAAVPDGQGYVWVICARDHTWEGRPVSDYPVVPGSNGGTGFGVTYSLSVTGGVRKARNTFAVLQTGSNGTYYICPELPYPDEPPE